ncbi:MAG: hypothetical protein IT445_04930 [Phycisphaeraceae bacterium]|nr:hypothetical protein [Phycisphaeraceae bacterium]
MSDFKVIKVRTGLFAAQVHGEQADERPGECAAASVDPDVGNLRIVPIASGVTLSPRIVIGQEQPTPQGWYSSAYGQYEPSPAVIYSARTTSNSTDIAWLLLPYRGADAPATEAKLLAGSKDGMRLEVTLDGKRYVADIPMSSGLKAKLMVK